MGFCSFMMFTTRLNMKALLRLALIAFSLAGRDSFQTRVVVRCSRSLHQPPSGFPFLTLPQQQQGRSKTTSLSAFLPPSGGGGKKSELGEIATTVLTFLGITAFFISPLGGLFFALFNSLLALAILVPIGGIVAFNVWQYFNTTTGTCPNCGSPVKAMNDESPSFCFTCGAIVQAKDGQIFLANPNNINGGDNMKDGFVQDGSVFTTWIDEWSGVRRTPNGEDDVVQGTASTPTIKSSSSRKTPIIDVDVERDDD